MKPEIFRLSNGIRVVIDPMAGLESTAIGVWVNGGAVDEGEEEGGLAHLLEHMAFKGTKRRTARAIAEEIEAVGGYLNAATSHQRTGYYARVLSGDTALAVDILSDILLNPTFDDSELEREKEVIVQEIGEAADTPDDVVFERLTAAAWGDAPLGRPILGTPQSVRAQTPVSLRSFTERLYGPASMVIAVSGAVDGERFLDIAEKAFGDLRSREAPPSRTTPLWRGGDAHDGRDIEQTHLALAFPGVATRHDDFFATRIYADILGGGMSSRLFQKVREERGLAYSVYAFADGYDDVGLTGAYVGADAAHIVEAAALIRGEMEALTREISETEMSRVRAMLRSSLLMSLESPASRIEAAAGQLFARGEILTPQAINEHLEAVSIDDVKRCAMRALEGTPAVSMVGAGDMTGVGAALKG